MACAMIHDRCSAEVVIFSQRNEPLLWGSHAITASFVTLITNNKLMGQELSLRASETNLLYLRLLSQDNKQINL